MNKKTFVFTICSGIFLLSYPLILGNSLLPAGAECIKDTTNISSENNKKIVDETKENIIIQKSVELFKNYIEENSTDWQKVQFENLNRDPVKSLTDYAIISTELVYSEKDNFTIKVTYDIKYTDESDMWLAGNGLKEEDNWIRNKINYVNINKENNEYKIINIYT